MLLLISGAISNSNAVIRQEFRKLRFQMIDDNEVMRFFMSCEADGVKMENCAPYIRESMEREKD